MYHMNVIQLVPEKKNEDGKFSTCILYIQGTLGSIFIGFLHIIFQTENIWLFSTWV